LQLKGDVRPLKIKEEHFKKRLFTVKNLVSGIYDTLVALGMSVIVVLGNNWWVPTVDVMFVTCCLLRAHASSTLLTTGGK
jgi:hypothetical protein